MVQSSKTNISLERQMELLRMELAYELKSYQQHLDNGNISGRANTPTLHYPITIGQINRNAIDQIILPIFYEADDATDSDFEPGRPTSLFKLSSDGSQLIELPHQCYIDHVSDGCISIIVPNTAVLNSIKDNAQQHLLGIQLCTDTTSYRVMLESLTRAIHSEDPKFCRLRDTLIGTLQPRFRELPQLSFPWLNRSQNEAIQKVVEAQDVAVVHGPPGTGKTTTLVEAIIETLQREDQVLVCAPSNAAVDWISEQLMRRGVNVLRIGNALRISDEMLECSYERRYASHPDYPELWSIRKALRQGIANGKSQEKQAKLHKLRERQTELEIKINADLFNQARVVSCTLIGSAYHILEHHHFSTLFIDEAAQALQPACWSAILKADRVILSGDHQQLPPTVKCPEAQHGGLDRTLMQHLVQSKPQCVKLLNTQYRMHQQIMQFSSEYFYHGQLEAAPQVADRLISPMDTPLTWIDTSQCEFGEKENSRSKSKSNAQEARLLLHVMRDYIDMVSMPRIIDDRVDFGIISPYKAQVRLIRKLLKMQHFFRPIKRQVSVGSVDGFQGQERDVIIISMVRDNDQGNIGFLRDLRRMNVAITRARMKIIIIGNTQTLAKHPFYSRLIKHFEEHGQIIQAATENQ